jgi:putative hydrolase of the HAD superfamily
MVLRIPGRVIVFDYGDVISAAQSESDTTAILAVAGAEPAAFFPAYWRHRDELDHGVISTAEYWRRIGADLGTEFSLSQQQLLWAADFRSWTSVDPGTVDLIAELLAGATRIALLSNAGFDFGDPLRRSPLGGLFERVFVSSELGLIKPDPQIYLRVASELGIDPSEMVFIDNKAVNVDAARTLGVTGHVFRSSGGLRGFLEGLAD